MKFRHIILLSSSYKYGLRIAYHISGTKESDFEELERISSDVDRQPYSVYSVETESETWDSVVQHDMFYEGIKVCESFEEFIEYIELDKDITVFDLAKYIIARLQKEKIKCTHLKLQKLVYFCYEKYLITYKKKLFKEKIYAWKYGPVVRDLYNKIKAMDLTHEDSIILKVDFEDRIPRQRIIFSEDGLDKLEIIDEVINLYKEKTPKELVTISHEDGSAWDSWDKQTRNFEITDEAILKSCCY